MVLTCVTSRYLPNLKYIAKLCEVNCAVILDLAPLPNQTKNVFVSRNRICNNSGESIWLSVPISRRGVGLIRDAKIDKTNHSWINKHIKTIAHTYPSHKKVAGNFLNQLNCSLQDSDGSLIDINSRTLNLILDFLDLKNNNILLESSILEVHSKQHRLDVAKAINATSYLAGDVEWELMKKSGCIDEMEHLGINVKRSMEIDPSVVPVQLAKDFSCIHSMLTIGAKNTRSLITQMIRN